MSAQQPLIKTLFTESLEKHFNELKRCLPDKVAFHVMAIFDSFPFVTRDERDDYADAIYAFAVQHRKDRPLLFAYANLARAFNTFYVENYEKALPMLAETQKLFEEQGDLNGAAVCTGITGSIYRTMGIVDLSLKGMLAAHEQIKSYEEFMLFILASGVTVANIYVDQKHYDEAIRLYDEMLNLPDKPVKFYWDVYSLHGVAKIHLVEKNYEKALECLNRALSIAEAHSHPISICNSLSELGNYYFQVGELTTAEGYYKRSLEMREYHKFISGAITSCIRLGEIYIKQSRYEEAEQMLERGLQKAEEIKVKPKQSQIHHCLSQVYEKTNDLERSLFHFKRYHTLHDEVEEEESARKVKNVKAYFEAEQAKKENAVIKRQKEEIEKKNKELQETIDELTRARIGKKARAITLLIAIVMFIFEDTILHFALSIVNTENYFISMAVKMTIIFSLAPINKTIEKHMLKKVMRKKKEATPGIEALTA